MIIIHPEKIPAEPRPAATVSVHKRTTGERNLPTALPTMKALELGAAPHTADFATVSAHHDANIGAEN
jgi:hypothetical protein